jgi:acyl-CoA reductase-like NAD-dependent aldehyde dehydrogenase
MGALVNHEQRQDVQESVNKLIAAGCEALLGGQADLSAAGAFSRRPCCTARSRMKPRRFTPLKPLARWRP